MSILLSCYTNILETSTVTLSQGYADANYPLYRLYDRDIGRMFQSAAASVLEVKIDQGAGVLNPVDTVFIPAGHNLGGTLMALNYSDDDVNYFTGASWTQPDNYLIVQSFGSMAHRYWRLNISAMPMPGQLAELFLTSTYIWERMPVRPGGPFDDVFNVQAETSGYGRDRFLVHGPSKRQRVYRVQNASAQQYASIKALWGAWAGAKPFWLCDQDGNWIYGKLRKPLNLKEDGYSRYSFDFDFEEVVP
ncbi:MAG: hypothetical protein M0Z52_10540 [Actinomycetota bacterium]|nr:hypothetical protein [Actinomycetota bacterium]